MSLINKLEVMDLKRKLFNADQFQQSPIVGGDNCSFSIAYIVATRKNSICFRQQEGVRLEVE